MWILGSFLISFYSALLPPDPAYDFVHLRNYFLLTTLIIIVSQDIYFNIQKKSIDKKLNGLMLKDFKPNMETNLTSNSRKEEKILKFTDDFFDDETFFDVRNYKNKNELNEKTFKMRDNISELSEDNDLVARQNRINIFIGNNQNFLLVIFGLILAVKFLLSTGFMFTTVSSPFYKYLTLFIHFLIILTSITSNYLSINFFGNNT